MKVNCVVPVTGVPFIKETRHERKIELPEHTKTQLLMKMESKTPDAPYSDSFVIREAWLAVTKSETNKRCILQKYMKVDFLKYTMFKSQI